MDPVFNAETMKKKIATMDLKELVWFERIGVAGLKGSWKGHRREAECKEALKILRAEIARRKRRAR